MRAYLDASVLIAYLYGEIHAPERFVPVRQLFTAIGEKRLEAVITFDRHFLGVADLIPAYTPEEFLALPPRAADDNAGSESGGG